MTSPWILTLTKWPSLAELLSACLCFTAQTTLYSTVLTSALPKQPSRWVWRGFSVCWWINNLPSSFDALSASLWLTRSLFQLGDGKVSDVNVLEYKPRQQLAVKFSEHLTAGQDCVLTLEYAATLSNTYDGFYISSYTDKNGNKRYAWLLCYFLTHICTTGFKGGCNWNIT